jgi:hypothetical protein
MKTVEADVSFRGNEQEVIVSFPRHPDVPKVFVNAALLERYSIEACPKDQSVYLRKKQLSCGLECG